MAVITVRFHPQVRSPISPRTPGTPRPSRRIPFRSALSTRPIPEGIDGRPEEMETQLRA